MTDEPASSLTVEPAAIVTAEPTIVVRAEMTSVATLEVTPIPSETAEPIEPALPWVSVFSSNFEDGLPSVLVSDATWYIVNTEAGKAIQNDVLASVNSRQARTVLLRVERSQAMERRLPFHRHTATSSLLIQWPTAKLII